MGGFEEDKKNGGVPSWQLKPSDAPQGEKTEDQDSASQPTPSRASVIENARRFLLEDDVRNAPTDKQVAFLESKGLESHEIRELLGVARDVEATGSNSEVHSHPLQLIQHLCLTYIAITPFRDIFEGGAVTATAGTISSASVANNSRRASHHNLSRIPRHARAAGPTDNRQTTPWDSISLRRPFSSPVWH
jgi:hypothetical protein